jgi:hypothetical protein
VNRLTPASGAHAWASSPAPQLVLGEARGVTPIIGGAAAVAGQHGMFDLTQAEAQQRAAAELLAEPTPAPFFFLPPWGQQGRDSHTTDGGQESELWARVIGYKGAREA